jgi:hypothetical protein
MMGKVILNNKPKWLPYHRQEHTRLGEIKRTWANKCQNRDKGSSCVVSLQCGIARLIK